jgi:hypothetical protein
MAKAHECVLEGSPARLYEALRRAVADLGYTIERADGRSMTLQFESNRRNMMKNPVKMTAVVVPTAQGQSKISMTGKDAHRAVTMWGEDGHVARLVFDGVQRELPGIPEAAAPAQQAAAAGLRDGSRDLISELERLAALHSNGALDDAEFRVAKERLLSAPTVFAAPLSGGASAVASGGRGIGAPLAAGAAGLAGGLMLSNVTNASAAPTAGAPESETINYHETFTGPDGETTTIDGTMESSVTYDDSGDAHMEIHDAGTVDVGGDTSAYSSDVGGDVDLGGAADGGGFLDGLFDLF